MTSMPAPAAEYGSNGSQGKTGHLRNSSEIDVDNGVFAAASWSGLLAHLLASGYKTPNLKIDCREVLPTNQWQELIAHRPLKQQALPWSHTWMNWLVA